MGITEMAGSLERTIGRPDLCIVGEPTSMQIVTRPQGQGVAAGSASRGSAGHSAVAPDHVNALHLACDLIGMLRQRRTRLPKAVSTQIRYGPFLTRPSMWEISWAAALST